MELRLDPSCLKPVIETVIAELLQRFDQNDDRLAYSEAEAAALLGVSRTTLRDERLRGRVKASLVGRKIRYTRNDMVEYLVNRRWEME